MTPNHSDVFGAGPSIFTSQDTDLVARHLAGEEPVPVPDAKITDIAGALARAAQRGREIRQELEKEIAESKKK